MNVMTNLMIPGLAILCSMSVVNAAHLPKNIPDAAIETIAEKCGYTKNFVLDSYQKTIAIRQADASELERFFGDSLSQLILKYLTFLALQ